MHRYMLGFWKKTNRVSGLPQAHFFGGKVHFFEKSYFFSAKNEKRKSFFRSLIKPVQAGANGTLNYVVKEGSGKNKIASKKQ